MYADQNARENSGGGAAEKSLAASHTELLTHLRTALYANSGGTTARNTVCVSPSRVLLLNHHTEPFLIDQ